MFQQQSRSGRTKNRGTVSPARPGKPARVGQRKNRSNRLLKKARERL